jgi:hypothetical protein
MTTIENWNGTSTAVRYSRGGVLTFERWEDNVLGLPPWPEALLRQVRGYVGQARYFSDEDAAALSSPLGGRISKFQSINSEDAVTYSWFGTLASAEPETRRCVTQWLYDRIGLDTTASAPAIDQWVRVFHPNAAGSSRGPELDARIDDPGSALIYVEAKWGADIGTGKGKDASVPDDQVVLRRDSLRNDPNRRDGVEALAVLGVSEAKPDLSRWAEPDETERVVLLAWLTWDDLAECAAHPHSDEFARYIAWKRSHA